MVFGVAPLTISSNNPLEYCCSFYLRPWVWWVWRIPFLREYWRLTLPSGHFGIPCITELIGTERGQCSWDEYPDYQEETGLVLHREDKEDFEIQRIYQLSFLIFKIVLVSRKL